MGLFDKTRILIVLQNAYDKGELAGGYSVAAWRREFRTSRSYRRLKVLIGPELYWISEPGSPIRMCNVCPKVGNGSESKGVPSKKKIRAALKRIRPVWVISCGTLAEGVVRKEWKGNLICVPHPTYRVLTNSLLETGHDILSEGLFYDLYPDTNRFNWGREHPELYEGTTRIALRQGRGSHSIEFLEGGHSITVQIDKAT